LVLLRFLIWFLFLIRLLVIMLLKLITVHFCLLNIFLVYDLEFILNAVTLVLLLYKVIK
jgi:hypothetical protein